MQTSKETASGKKQQNLCWEERELYNDIGDQLEPTAILNLVDAANNPVVFRLELSALGALHAMDKNDKKAALDNSYDAYTLANEANLIDSKFGTLAISVRCLALKMNKKYDQICDLLSSSLSRPIKCKSDLVRRREDFAILWRASIPPKFAKQVQACADQYLASLDSAKNVPAQDIRLQKISALHLSSSMQLKQNDFAGAIQNATKAQELALGCAKYQQYLQAESLYLIAKAKNKQYKSQKTGADIKNAGLAEINKAVALKPTYLRYYIEKMSIQNDLCHYSDAVSTADEAIKIHKDSAYNIDCWKAYSLENMGDLVRALKVTDEQIAIKKSPIFAYGMRIRLFRKLGDKKQEQENRNIYNKLCSKDIGDQQK